MAKRYHDGYYSGNEDRRHQEMKDAGMISEDRSAVANLPQDVKYHSWGGDKPWLDGRLDDTIRGVDKQQREDTDGTKRNMGVHKW